MKTILKDNAGNAFNANILFTYNDREHKKDYVIYEIDKELYASSYESRNNEFIIKNDLTNQEYDMIDKIIAIRMENIDE